MNDIDVLAGRDFDRALELIVRQGYEANMEWHSADLSNGLDLHRVIYKNFSSPEREAPIWQRAHAASLYGETVWIPCPEDMLAILLNNEVGNLLDSFPTEKRRIKFCVDLLFLLRKPMNWELFAAICEEQEISAAVRIMAEAIDIRLPGLLPKEFPREKLRTDPAGLQILHLRKRLRDVTRNYDDLVLTHRSIAMQAIALGHIWIKEYALWQAYGTGENFLHFLLTRWHVDSGKDFLKKFFKKLTLRLKKSDPRLLAMQRAEKKRNANEKTSR